MDAAPAIPRRASSQALQAELITAVAKLTSGGTNLRRVDLLRELTAVSRVLSEAPELATAAQKDGILGVVSDVLRNMSDDPSAVAVIVAALRAVAASVRDCDAQVTVPSDMCDAVVAALRCHMDEGSVTKEACRVVERLFRRDINARQLISSGVAELLVAAARRHRRHEDTIAAVCDACACVEIPSVHDALLAAGWPTALVSLADARISVALFRSTVGPAFVQCACSERTKLALVEAGAREALLAIAARSADPLSMACIVGVLGVLALAHGLTPEVAAGQVAVAVRCLATRSHGGGQVAALLRRALAGKRLDPTGASPELDLSSRACAIMAVSLQHMRAEAVPAGLAKQLVEHLREVAGTSATVCATACAALAALADMRSWELASAIIECKGIKALVNLMKDSTLAAQERGLELHGQAANVLVALSKYKKAAPALVGDGACSALAGELAAGGEFALTTPIAQALHNILTHQPSAAGLLARTPDVIKVLGASVRGSTTAEWWHSHALVRAGSFCLGAFLTLATILTTEISFWCAVVLSLVPRIVAYPPLVWLLLHNDAWKCLSLLFALAMHKMGHSWLCTGIHTVIMWWSLSFSLLGALGIALATLGVATIWEAWLEIASYLRLSWIESVALSATPSAGIVGWLKGNVPRAPPSSLRELADLANPRFSPLYRYFLRLFGGDSDTSAPGVPSDSDVQKLEQERDEAFWSSTLERDQECAVRLLLVTQLASHRAGQRQLLADSALHWIRQTAEIRGYGGMTAVAACLVMAELVRCDAAVLQPQLAKVHQMLTACLQPPPALQSEGSVAGLQRRVRAAGGIRAQRALAALKCTLALVRTHGQFNGQLLTSGVVAAAVAAMRTYGIASAARALPADAEAEVEADADADASAGTGAGAGAGAGSASVAALSAGAAASELSVHAGVTEIAARLLALLAAEDAFCGKLVAAGALDALAEALASPAAAAAACWRGIATCGNVVRQLAAVPVGKLAIVAHSGSDDGGTLLLQLTSVERLRCAAFAVHACGAIRNISAAAEHRPALMLAGAGNALLLAMRRHSASREVAWSAMGALFGLCCEQRHCTELQATGAAAAAVAALQHLDLDAELAWAACGVLLRLSQAAVAARDELRLAELHSAGAAAALAAVLVTYHDDPRVVRAARAALRLLYDDTA